MNFTTILLFSPIPKENTEIMCWRTGYFTDLQVQILEVDDHARIVQLEQDHALLEPLVFHRKSVKRDRVCFVECYPYFRIGPSGLPAS